MSMRCIAVASAMALAGSALGSGALHELWIVDNSSGDIEIPGFSTSHMTVDLMVNIYGSSSWGDNQWTSTDAELTIHSGSATIWEHPLGTGVAQPDMWPFYPALEFDSFYNAPPGFTAPSFAAPVITEPQYWHATWFSTPPSGGNGWHLIARYTFELGSESWFTLQGATTTAGTGAELFPFYFEGLLPPTPGTAASLLIVGLAGLSRRRR